jgi:hypothetical protein
MTDTSALPLYYPGKSLADMEAMLRADYLRRSGWLESAGRKMALRDGAPVPWFTYPAIAFLERELTPDLALFEYGGGQSTLYWARRLARVEAVDHDPAFTAHIGPRLPANARLDLVAEDAPLAPGLARHAACAPALPEPERSVRTLRSGQLNAPFRAYALQLLSHPQGAFDVVVVDGMARVLSTWAAIRHFRKNGFIVFDNADRAEYAAAYDMLEAAGYRRIDFWGLGPVNPYEWCTAIFYHHRSFTQSRWFARRESRRNGGAAAPDGPDGANEPGGAR